MLAGMAREETEVCGAGEMCPGPSLGTLRKGLTGSRAEGLLGTRAFSSKMEQCQVNWTIGHLRVEHPRGVTLEKVAPGRGGGW